MILRDTVEQRLQWHIVAAVEGNIITYAIYQNQLGVAIKEIEFNVFFKYLHYSNHFRISYTQK